MAKRKIKEIVGNGRRMTRVYWDTDWQEFVVRFYQDRSLIPERDYFTDDLPDAIMTAHRMVE